MQEIRSIKSVCKNDSDAIDAIRLYMGFMRNITGKQVSLHTFLSRYLFLKSKYFVTAKQVCSI